jgi:hypothetical protein
LDPEDPEDPEAPEELVSFAESDDFGPDDPEDPDELFDDELRLSLR